MEIQLHALLLVWVGLVLLRILVGPLLGDPGPRSAALLALEGVAVLLAAIIHELGRLAVAARAGALPLSVALWPLGGLEDLPPHAESRTRIAAGAGGFGALLFVGAGVGLALFLATGAVRGIVVPSPFGELDPGRLVRPDGRQPGWLIVLHEFQRGLLAVMAINLVPVAPLAGGRLVEAGLMASRGRAAARRIAVQVWLVSACILLLAATAVGAWLGVLAAAVGGVSAAASLVREPEGPDDEPLAAMPSRPADAARSAPTVKQPTSRPTRNRSPEDPLAGASEIPLAESDTGDGDIVEDLLRDVGVHLDVTIDGDEPATRRGDATTESPPRSPSSRVKAGGPDAGGDENALDLVLAKIARDGMASLDAADRAVLEHETARRRASD